MGDVHPNWSIRTGNRAFQVDQPWAQAVQPGIPNLQPRSQSAPLFDQHLRDEAHARYVSMMEKEKQEDEKRDWINNTNGELLPNLPEKPARYWGQRDNEVVLVLPPSSLMFAGSRMSSVSSVYCYLTVEEIQEEIRELHCLEALPPPPPLQGMPRMFGEIMDRFRGRAMGNYMESDSDEDNRSPAAPHVANPTPPEIIDLYHRFLRNCSMSQIMESSSFGCWNARSLQRKRAGQDERGDMTDDDTLHPVLHITFYDIETFVRQDPRERNLQRFVNENRVDWNSRYENSDTFLPYCSYREDLNSNSAPGVVQSAIHSADSTGDDERVTYSRVHQRPPGGGGKRRKPATKRKARRSASSKRKQTAAAKRRRTTTKSKRTHHARRRRTTRRN